MKYSFTIYFNLSTTDSQMDDGRTSFHIASLEGSIDLIKLLYEKGAMIHTCDHVENSALHYCALAGNFEL